MAQLLYLGKLGPNLVLFAKVALRRFGLVPKLWLAGLGRQGGLTGS